MPWLSHTFLLVHPKYHVEKLSITSHRAGKCAALETFYDKSLWKSCSLVVKALMCANNWLTTVSFLWRSKLCTLWCCVMSSKKANLSDVWQSVRAVKFPSSEKKGKEKKSFSVDPQLSHLTALWSIPSSYSAWMSSRICGNWGWYMALEKLKLMVFTPRFIT